MRILSTLALVAGVALSAQESAVAQIPPSIEFRVPKPPTVAINDSGAFLVYELHVTNLTTNAMALRRVEVMDGSPGGRTLNTLAFAPQPMSAADSALLGVISRPGLAGNAPLAGRTQIGAGLRAIVYLWVRVDRNSPPRSLRHRLTIQGTSADTTVQVLDGWPVNVETSAVAITPPLRGDWLAANGPSQASGHRRLVLALNGAVASGQRFAIDYLQVDSTGATFKGDRTKNENYYAEGNEALAVGDGVVVETKDSIPENVPGGRAVAITLVTVAGNHIVVDLGNGHFAFYAHLKPGSLRVRLGDRVKRGQVLGLVGNSGNSTEPHLHFHISDAVASGTSTLGSEGIPYALPSFDVIGRCTLTTRITCGPSTPVTVRNGMPMQNQHVRFPK